MAVSREIKKHTDAPIRISLQILIKQITYQRALKQYRHYSILTLLPPTKHHYSELLSVKIWAYNIHFFTAHHDLLQFWTSTQVPVFLYQSPEQHKSKCYQPFLTTFHNRQKRTSVLFWAGVGEQCLFPFAFFKKMLSYCDLVKLYWFAIWYGEVGGNIYKINYALKAPVNLKENSYTHPPAKNT